MSTGIKVIVALTITFTRARRVGVINLMTDLKVNNVTMTFTTRGILRRLLNKLIVCVSQPFSVSSCVNLPSNAFNQMRTVKLQSAGVQITNGKAITVIPGGIVVRSAIRGFSKTGGIVTVACLGLCHTIAPRRRTLVHRIVLRDARSLSNVSPHDASVIFHSLSRGRLARTRVAFFVLNSKSDAVRVQQRLLTVTDRRLATHLGRCKVTFSVRRPAICMSSPVAIWPQSPARRSNPYLPGGCSVSLVSGY